MEEETPVHGFPASAGCQSRKVRGALSQLILSLEGELANLPNGIEEEKAAGMSTVAAAGDDSSVAELQLDSDSHCHGGAPAEVGVLEEEPSDVGVVVEEQALAAEDDQEDEDAVAGRTADGEESDKKIEEEEENEKENADAGNSTVVKELLTDLLHKVGEEDSAEESETPVRLRAKSRASSQEPSGSKARMSRQSSCEEPVTRVGTATSRSRHSSSEQEGASVRRLRTRTAPVASGNDPASIRANMEPAPKSVDELKRSEEKVKDIKGESVVVNVPKKKLRKDKQDFQHNKEARSEAEVLKRVAELQREGLWSKKMAKRDGEGHGQGKIHWDFVLEEMIWLSGVVQQEVKAKKMNAKKCAMMIQKHFKDRELSVARAERNREANLKKIALTMSREVKTFWGNVNKLFEYRLKIKLDGKKKEALDQHLNFIVDKTEKYSSLLAESLAVETGGSKEGSAAPSRAESVMSGDTGEQGEGDDEYSPDVDSDDDEETIDKEEKEVVPEEEKGNENEIDMLENEADVPLEDLLKKYYPDSVDDLAERATSKMIKDTTAAEKEEVKTKEDSVEEDVSGTGRSKRRRKPIDFEEVQARIKEEEELQQKEKEPQKGEKDIGKKDESKKEEEEKHEGESSLEEYANLAAELAPTGNTLDTTTVKTKVPFLLKHTLREYQHIGLDWMVSLFERSLNGILADEMGLGKTIQTIAFLAHLALEKSMWGPHLIVVPTSVMLNWEMEIKKWCPAFKVLVYYGSQKDRRMKRQGWTKQNAFHICITSYKLVIQDHSSFRRFKWQYFILDEAQHIKNFKSQRWQLLLNFSSLGRLLLTGTPLQNNLMELWSLMHFLMPHVFESHRDFKEWFSNPMAGMVEGNSEYNDSLIKRLHKVLRPFILRRLKSEVEKQMPKKYEHLVKCPLSKRQRYLYDDFMSRAKTKDTLASGNLLSVINVLMQLRKCCNHPNLFEPRPTISPLVATPVQVKLPSRVSRLLTYQPLAKVDLAATPLLISPLETSVSGYSWFRASVLRCPEGQMLNPPEQKPSPCPKGKMRLVLKSATPSLPSTLAVTSVMPHKFCMAEPHPIVGQVIPVRLLARPDLWLWDGDVKIKTGDGYFQPTPMVQKNEDEVLRREVDYWHPPMVYQPETRGHKRRIGESGEVEIVDPYQDIFRHARGIFTTALFKGDQIQGEGGRSPTKVIGFKRRKLDLKAREDDLLMPELEALKEEEMVARRKLNLMLNDRRTCQAPVYGSELVELAQELSLAPKKDLREWLENLSFSKKPSNPVLKGSIRKMEVSCYQSSSLVPSMSKVLTTLAPIFKEFVMYVPAVGVTPPPSEDQFCISADQRRFPGDFLQSRFAVQAPDTRLIQYDCGKLQILANLLRTLQAGGHRVLIFTQMTKMLDVLEAFLNYHGYVYMRLDGSTRVEMRQCLMERFNNDSKYFAFILSTRSGGVGINLTGADTVIFYDSDWNPTMDAQAQDRCHRIGQTRDVHIYRLVSERTVEENILKKANQKRLLGDIAIEGGNFTTAFFKKSTISDLFDNSAAENSVDDDEEMVERTDSTSKKSIGAFENALATAEDDTDILATKEARAEENADENDFKEEEDQFNAVLAELSSVERYALRHLEGEQAGYVQGQLEAAEAEIEARKEEFDAEKLEELTKEIREEMGDESTDEEDDEKEEEEEDEEVEGDESEASDMEVGDYSPVESGSDDEDTIEKEEKEEPKEEFEIDMLENEAEVPIEELLKLYYPDQLKQMQGEVVEEQAEETNGLDGRRKTTRSRGAIEINLWDLENPEDTLKSSSVKK